MNNSPQPLDQQGQPHPVWMGSTPQPRFPSLPSDLRVDVAVVGAGITGLTTAALLRQQGLTVAVLTQGRVGQGASGHTTAHLTQVLDVDYTTLVNDFGREIAHLAVHASGAAIDIIQRLCREFGMDCHLRRISGYRYTERAEEIENLRADAQAGRDLGLPIELVTTLPLQIKPKAAFRITDQGEFHPLRYLLGLAHVVHGNGGYVFEDTLVEDYHTGSPCILKTPRGTITCGHLVIATHTPMGKVLSIQSRLNPTNTYAIAARLQHPATAGVYWDMAEPYHYIRTYPNDDTLLIVGGCDHHTGENTDASQHHRDLVEYTRQRFPVESIEYRWSHQVFNSADGLPFIGAMPGADNVYFGSGYSGNGMTFGTVAGVIITDLMLNRSNSWAAAFTPSRIKPIAAARDAITENLTTAWRFVADRLATPEAQSTLDVQMGQGKIVEIEGNKAAVYRDNRNKLHVMSPVCRHMGCFVNWNNDQHTWDCPCHGGRYSATGHLLSGPPTRGLERQVSAEEEEAELQDRRPFGSHAHDQSAAPGTAPGRHAGTEQRQPAEESPRLKARRRTQKPEA